MNAKLYIIPFEYSIQNYVYPTRPCNHARVPLLPTHRPASLFDLPNRPIGHVSTEYQEISGFFAERPRGQELVVFS